MTNQIVRTGNTYFFYSKKEMNAFLADQRLYAMRDHSITDCSLGTICGIWNKVLDMYTITIFTVKSTMMELLTNTK